MRQRVCVLGLWHLGSVTAACLAAAGSDVIGLDTQAAVVESLRMGTPPVAEPGLSEILSIETKSGRLRFTTETTEALRESSILWVTFDTPVDEQDRADAAWVGQQMDRVRPFLRPGSLVVISSQVPVGFTREVERRWRAVDASLRFVYVPENLRLGQAIDRFQHPERVVVGLGDQTPREPLLDLLAPMRTRIEWMSLESAEMSKHALNGFLAISAMYANEVARVCECVGADASDVERALKSDARIGPGAYVAPGGPIAGGTLARDFTLLAGLARDRGIVVPLLDAMAVSNRVHRQWILERVQALVRGIPQPRVAILGLTYKPDTDTLRRSAALELGLSLAGLGMTVRAFDPAVRELPAGVHAIELASAVGDLLEEADVGVLMTPWPQFKTIQANDLVEHMRHARVVDQTGFLHHLAADPRVLYWQVGRAPEPAGSTA